MGWHNENTCPNSASYADDMVLLSPQMGALRELMNKCEVYAKPHGLLYDSVKSKVMGFKPGKIKPCHIPAVTLGGVVLKIVNKFKYL